MSRLHRGLHDMAQPLASLQCRLELGKMSGDGESLAETVEGALEDVARICAIFSHLRDALELADRDHGQP